MSTLRRLVDDLGASVLELLAAPAGLDVPLSGAVLLHDATDPPPLSRGDVVAVPGLIPSAETARLLRGFSSSGAAAVLAKSGGEGKWLAACADEAAIALLAVRAGGSWVQVIQLVTALLSTDVLGRPGESMAGAQAGDLFAIANVVADLVDAPITIEDTQSRVIAFSSRQEQADAARTATILGRGVPEEWAARLRSLGVFTRLAGAREPLYLTDIGPGVLPRVAVAVRAGDQLLGSIWAAVHEPLAPERQQALMDATGMVALHLLRHHVAADAERTLENALLGAVLEGSELAAEALRRLNIGGHLFRVVGFAIGETLPSDGDSEHAELSRLKHLAALNLSSPDGRAVCGQMAGTVYAILPARTGDGVAARGLHATVDTFVARASSLLGRRVVAGIGPLADGSAAIPQSRAGADEVLRVLLSERRDLAVADLDLVRADVLLRRFVDACASGPAIAGSPLARLRAHDDRHRTAYVATVRAYLDAFGDVEAAARQLGVHANTVRYRLRQAEESLGVNLREPTERLSLELELRLARGGGSAA